MNTAFRTLTRALQNLVLWAIFLPVLVMWLVWVLTSITGAVDACSFIIPQGNPGPLSELPMSYRMIIDTAFFWLPLIGLPLFALFLRLKKRWYGIPEFEDWASVAIVRWCRLIPKT